MALEGDLGCISGCALGFGGVLYLYGAMYDRNCWLLEDRSLIVALACNQCVVLQ